MGNGRGCRRRREARAPTPGQEATAFDSAATLVMAMHMSKDGNIEVVTASAEQMPSTCNPIGLLSKIGL